MKTLLFLLLSVPAFAQFEQGSIVGSVVDPQKAPIINATVQIRSTTTNVSREVTTGQSGGYNSLPLPPGPYTVTVHQQGFRDRAAEVNVGVSQRVEMDFALELGSVTDKVVV